MKKNGINTNFFGVHLPDDLAKKIREHAELYGRSVSGEIRVMVRDAIAERESTTHQFAQPKNTKTP